MNFIGKVIDSKFTGKVYNDVSFYDRGCNNIAINGKLDLGMVYWGFFACDGKTIFKELFYSSVYDLDKLLNHIDRVVQRGASMEGIPENIIPLVDGNHSLFKDRRCTVISMMNNMVHDALDIQLGNSYNLTGSFGNRVTTHSPYVTFELVIGYNKNAFLHRMDDLSKIIWSKNNTLKKVPVSKYTFEPIK